MNNNDDILKKYLFPLFENPNYFILLSLWVSLGAAIVSIFSTPLPFNALSNSSGFMTFSILLNYLGRLLAIPLFAAQIYAFVNKKKTAWILSLLQVFLAAYLVIGTFNFILTPLFFFKFPRLILSITIVLAEILKTMYFYNTCKK